jgi:hypothetical protein
MRWTGADTLAVEIPLEGGETTLTSVDIAGNGVVSLPPVCLPYSPEFKPTQKDRGLVTMERLGRATAGRERVDLTNIWKDLPRQVRLISISKWLLLAAVVLWLIEVLERRTSLLSLLQRGKRKDISQTDKPEKGRLITETPKRARSKQAKPAAAPEPWPRPEPEKPAPRQVPVVARTEGGGLSEALKKARQRSRERIE